MRATTNENAKELSMRPHYENKLIKAFTDVNDQFEYPLVAPLLSGFAMIKSQPGGNLLIFNKAKGPNPTTDLNSKNVVKLNDGDFVFFNAGDYFHAAEPIRGNGIRRTVGSFVNVIQSEKKLEFWL